MRRFAEILFFICFAGFLVWEFVRDFRENDPIGFFRSHPYELVTVSVIALLGTAVFFLWSKISVGVRYRISLVLFLPFAVWISMFAVRSWSMRIGMSEFWKSSEMLAEITLTAFVFSALTFASWSVCYLLLRRCQFTILGATKTVEPTGISRLDSDAL